MGAIELAYFIRWRVYAQNERTEAKMLTIAKIQDWQTTEDVKVAAIAIVNDKF